MSNGTLVGHRTVEIDRLKPHPQNDKIYGDPRLSQDFAAFVEDVKENGIHPLIVADDMTIIGGHRRYYAALALGRTRVDAAIFHYGSDTDKLAALIADNNVRIKSNWQLANEAEALMGIAEERARQRQATSTGGAQPQLVELVPQAGNGKARDEVGEQLGVSGRTVGDMIVVKRTVERLEIAGASNEAQELRAQLDKNVKQAAQAARQIERQQEPAKPKPERPLISVTEWQTADAAKRAEWLFTQHGSTHTYNQTNDNVEWALWSWNPVTGCLHNCAYCYARDIANRFFTHLPDGERFAPVFYPDRLSGPRNTKQPDLTKIEDPIRRIGLQNVFVCSMADLFGKWVPTEWIDAVLQQAWENPQWNFLFLTKFPIRMAEFEYPPNTWIGTTVDTQYAVERAEKAFRKVRDTGYEGVAWLSCEPMMERLTFSSLDMFDWVVMGGSSRSTQTPAFAPPMEWWIHLWNQAKAFNLPVYQKTNLIQQNGAAVDADNRVREYPL